MLLHEIFRLVLGTLAGLLGSALLLRVYLTWLRISRSNPMVVFCVALSEWIVTPCRHLVGQRGRFDGASFLAALVVASVFVFIMQLVAFGASGNWALFLPSVLLLLVRWALYLVLVLVFANWLLTLVNPHAPLAPTFDALARPLLAPLRRMIPPIGGFDLSPLALIVLVQVVLLVVEQAGL